MTYAAMAGLGGAAIGAWSSRKNTKAMAEANKPDPRIGDVIFGKNGSGGLIDQYQALGKEPQSAGLLEYGQGQDNYLKAFGNGDMQGLRDASGKLMNSGLTAPTLGATQKVGSFGQDVMWNKGETVKAPSQNEMDLSGSYNRFINGPAGANPYLTGAIQKGINQSSNAFGNYLQDAKSATQDVLGSVRSNSVLSGQYGGSRQGLAEGKAIESMNTQLGRAASQFGQNNTDAAVAAQAGAYDADSNRALSATQGLGAQQYGVAQTNAGLAQQANMANQAAGNQASQFNANQLQNASSQNAQLAQQGALANMNAQQQTNQLNSANQIAGIGTGQGLLSQTIGGATNQDNYALNKAGQVNGLLSPYLSQNGGQQQPMTQNTAGNVLGGAMAGLGLFNQFNQASKPPNVGDGSFATDAFKNSPFGNYFG